MTALLVLLGSVLAMILVVMTTAVLGICLTARTVRRSRTYNRGRLLARAATAGSRPAREIARLRVELYDTVAATGRVLVTVAVPHVLTQLAADLSRAAAAADRRLSLLAAEPDRALLDRLARPLAEDVRALCAASAEVRDTALRFAYDLDQQRVRALTQEVADQVAGLRAGLVAVQVLRA